MQIDRDYELTQTLDVPEIAPLPSIRSERAATVAKWFGIDDQINHPEPTPARDQRTDRKLLRSLLPKSGQITLLTGPSGAGKSSMLRALRSGRPRARFLDLNEIQLPDVPLVDCFDGAPLDQTLALLSRVGLAEAWSYLRTPVELSEGQRWRLKLALGMSEAVGVWASARMSPVSDLTPDEMPCGLKPTRRSEGLPDRSLQLANRLILIADEFAALLDRVTASIVARCLRRSIGATPKLCAIVATSHEDLIRALSPDVIVHCDFRWIEVFRRTEGQPATKRVDESLAPSRVKKRQRVRSAMAQATTTRASARLTVMSSDSSPTPPAPSESKTPVEYSPANAPTDDVATR